ncbi:MAG: hypothetical protein IPL11_01130 [Candidatus Accumulibacter sp.]|nr:hypothetical protein [Accumulibacter sp.]
MGGLLFRLASQFNFSAILQALNAAATRIPEWRRSVDQGTVLVVEDTLASLKLLTDTLRT